MKKFAAALSMSFAFAASLASAPVLAQAPATQTAAANAVDPAAAAAVRELLAAMDYKTVMLESFRQMTASLPAAIKAGAEGAVRADPKLNEAQRAEKLAEVEKGLPRITAAISRTYSDPALIDEMIEAMVPIYARHYTPAEMREMAAFYKTPVGAKTLRLMPQLMNEGMQVGQQVIMPRMQKLMQELQGQEKK